MQEKLSGNFLRGKGGFIVVIMSISISVCDSDDFDDVRITITEAYSIFFVYFSFWFSNHKNWKVVICKI